MRRNSNLLLQLLLQDGGEVFRNLERAEDLSRDAMLEGIDWTWETFPQFLDAVDALPKGINYAG